VRTASSLSGARLSALAWFVVLLLGVVLLTVYTVNNGLFAVLLIVPLVGALALPWHLRLSYLLVMACFQSALIVPFAPGPLYFWLGACVPAWSGLTLAIIFRHVPNDVVGSVRRNWPVFLGIGVYCLNLLVTLNIRGFGLNVFGSAKAMGGRFPIEQLMCSILPLAFLCVKTTEKEFSMLYRLQLAMAGTFIVSEIAVGLGSGPFLYLFYLFAPSSDMTYFAEAEFVSFTRYQSLKLAAPAALFLLLVSTDVRRFKNMHAVYLVPGAMLLIGLSLLSGHREALILTFSVAFAYLVAVRFFNMVTWLSLGLATAAVYVLLFVGMEFLPLAMQRAVSIVPGLPVSEIAANDATGSFILRREVIRLGWSQVPEHLLLGRAFVISPLPTIVESENLIANHLWRGHFYNGFVGLLVHTGVIGTLGAILIFGGGVALAMRVIRRVRARGVRSLLDRIAAMLASYCMIKPFYFLVVNGNAMVVMQEMMVPISMLLLAERFLSDRRRPAGETLGAEGA